MASVSRASLPALADFAVPDDELLATCIRIRPLLGEMADGDGTDLERAGARLALRCVEDVIRDIAGRLS
jgi:hypothetical protein